MKTTMTTGELVKILNLTEEKKVTPEAVQIALENGTFADFLEAVANGPVDRKELRKILGLPSLDDKLKELITLGKYDWVNGDIIAKYFPVVEVPTLEGENLFHFNRNISSEDAIAEMDKVGYRPATMAELLVYGAKNPEMQRQFPIVALGSVAQIDGTRRVGILGEGGSGRKLNLDYFDGGWGGGCRFLAVRK